MNEAIKRAEEAKRERLFLAAQLANKVSHEILDALKKRDTDGVQKVEAALGEFNYMLEFMIKEGDVRAEVLIKGMFDLANGIDQITQHQPMSSISEMKGRFEMKRDPNVPEEAPNE